MKGRTGKMKKNNREESIKIKFTKLKEAIKPKPKYFRNMIMAFIIGGLICTIGAIIFNIRVRLTSAILPAT